jgi:hypothetical protein
VRRDGAIVAVVAVLLACVPAAGGEAPPFTHQAPPISGRVVDAVTGRPVVGASVLVYWPGRFAAPPFFFDALAVRETVTDAAGGFAIPAWRSSSLASRPGDVAPTLLALAPEYAVASVVVGWRGGEALRVPLDFPRAADRTARDLMYVAATLGFLAASLDGDAPLAFLDAVDREWRALPPEEQKGQASVRPMFEHARSEGRALIAEWKRRYPDGPSP